MSANARRQHWGLQSHKLGWYVTLIVTVLTLLLLAAAVWRQHRERQYIRAIRELQQRGGVLVVEVEQRASWLDSLPGWLSRLARYVVRPGIGARIGFDLSGVEITDAVLENVNRVRDLAWLRLSGTTITDAGLARLRGLKDLEYLDVSDTLVTDGGLARLVERLPKLAVVVKAGGSREVIADRLNCGTPVPVGSFSPRGSGG